MFKKFLHWLINLVLIFPRKKESYGLVFSKVRSENGTRYIDICYNFKLVLDPEKISYYEKMNIPLNIILANDFKEELDGSLGKSVGNLLNL